MRVQLLDKVFEISITEARIINAIKKIAQEIARDLRDKDPLLIPALKQQGMSST